MRSFSIAILILYLSAISAEAGLLPLLKAGGGAAGGNIVQGFYIQPAAAGFYLQADGVSKYQWIQ